MAPRNRLKIAVLVKSFTLSGGMEKYAVEVACRLRNWGHHIDVYTREVDRKCCAGMGVYLLPFRCTFSGVLSAVALAADFDRAMEGKVYDVVHSHERGYHQDVLTNHCFTYRGSLGGYSFLRRLDYLLLSPRTWMYLYLESLQMKTSYLVGVSGAIKNDIYDHYQRTDARVIPPGVDCEKFHPDMVRNKRQQVRASLALKNEEKMVLFVGSDFKRKGLDYLIPVAQHQGVRLVVVGRGDKLSHFKQKVSTLGVVDKVNFTGLVDCVTDYYAAADLVVLPSNSEAFGMSILEAMACGLPTLVSANSGVSALVENGKNGYIDNDKVNIAQTVIGILKSDTVGVGKRARKTAELCNWDRAAAQYESLFREISQSKKDQ